MEVLPLKKWPPQMQIFLAVFLTVLTVGVTIGLIYLNYETSFSVGGAIENYQGTVLDEDFEIPDKYPKSYSGMLLSTHTHIIAFAFIFFILGGITFFSSKLSPGWKTFLMIEPLVSILVTFGSLWGLRYLHPVFASIAMFSGIIMYTSYYVIVFILLFELIKTDK